MITIKYKIKLYGNDIKENCMIETMNIYVDNKIKINKFKKELIK